MNNQQQSFAAPTAVPSASQHLAAANSFREKRTTITFGMGALAASAFLFAVCGLGVGIADGNWSLLVVAVILGGFFVRSYLVQKKKDADALAAKLAFEQRWLSLCQRFGEENARAILANRFWQGATVDAILESLGRPTDVDESVMKARTKHVFKYYPTGANRYGLRLTFEDGVLVGWDDKR